LNFAQTTFGTTLGVAAANPLGDELRMLDEIRRRVDHPRDRHFPSS
jgi:hypothetical protein